MKAHWHAPAGLHVASARLPVEGELPSLDGATGWLNSEPLTPVLPRTPSVAVSSRVAVLAAWS